MRQLLFLISALAAISCSRGEIYCVTDFGAVPDTTILSTKAIQDAIDCCSASGGGRVVVPKGEFKTGTILLRDGVVLEVAEGAVLYGSPCLCDYPYIPYDIVARCTQKPNYQLILAQNASNIGICGKGTIDGQGGKFPKIKGSQGGHIRPLLIRIVKCRNVSVQEIHLRNAARWMQHYLCCDTLSISGIDVFNRSNYNNDGMDIDGCRHVRVSGVRVDSDDDGIVLKSTSARACEDVLITDCTISSHCNGIKFGTETNTGFRNVRIEHCEILPSTDNSPLWWGREGGLGGLTLTIADGGTMEDILIHDISITGTQAPIFVRLCNRATPYSADIPVKGVGRIRGVTISGVRAVGAGLIGSSITGIPGHPVEDITLKDISIETLGGADPSAVYAEPGEYETSYPECTKLGTLPCYGLFLRHIDGLTMENVAFRAISPDPRPETMSIDVRNRSRDL